MSRNGCGFEKGSKGVQTGDMAAKMCKRDENASKRDEVGLAIQKQCRLVTWQRKRELQLGNMAEKGLAV